MNGCVDIATLAVIRPGARLRHSRTKALRIQLHQALCCGNQAPQSTDGLEDRQQAELSQIRPSSTRKKAAYENGSVTQQTRLCMISSQTNTKGSINTSVGENSASATAIDWLLEASHQIIVPQALQTHRHYTSPKASQFRGKSGRTFLRHAFYLLRHSATYETRRNSWFVQRRVLPRRYTSTCLFEVWRVTTLSSALKTRAEAYCAEMMAAVTIWR